jgi:hypothetical protein
MSSTLRLCVVCFICLMLHASPASAAPDAGTASVLDVKATGALAPAAVRAVLARAMTALRGCAGQHLAEAGSATVELTMEILGGGKGQSITVGGNVRAGLRGCVAAAVTGLRFPRAAGTTRASARLRLERLSAGAQARRRALAAKISKIGMLKILGSSGSGAPANVFGSGGLSGSSGDALGGLGIRAGGASGGGLSRSGGVGVGGLVRGRGVRGDIAIGVLGRGRVARGDMLGDKERAKRLAAALRVPGPTGRAARAPWLQGALPLRNSELLRDRRLVALGKQGAIVEADLEHSPDGKSSRVATIRLALDRRAGLLGVLAPPPDTRWLGLDGKDAVYAVTPEGQVHRAPSLRAATAAGGFIAAGRVAGAVSWSFSAGLIAALLPARVALSRDGGRTFFESAPPGAGPLKELALRYDGVIAVRTASGETALSSDGRRWQRSSFQPAALLSSGPWIYGASGCTHAVLSVDKKTWVEASLPSSLDPGNSRHADRWEALLSTSEQPDKTMGDPPSLFTPAPPAAKAAARVVGAPKACAPDRSGRYKLSGLIGRIGQGTCNYGALSLCLRGTAGHDPEPSSLWVGWLSDGRRDAAPAPTLVLVDRRQGTFRIGALPAGCRARRVEALVGTAVLLCERSPDLTQVYLADDAGAWHDEGQLAAPAAQLERVRAAPDGTLLVQSCHTSEERRTQEGSAHLCGTAFVRRPLKLGAPDAWREVLIHDALTYRPLAGGRALVVEHTGTGNDRITIALDDGKRRRPLLDGITLRSNPSELDVEDGRIYVQLSYSRYVLTRKKTFELLPR